MKVSHIEHLGIAVKSLEEAIPYWENVLGLKCYAIEEVADQKVKTAFFMIGQTKIELLEPTSEDSTKMPLFSCYVTSDFCDPMDSSLTGSSVHGIFQARILKWFAISFSRGSY